MVKDRTIGRELCLALLLSFALGCPAEAPAGKTPSAAHSCSLRHADCGEGTICSGTHRCVRECRRDADCPCGAFCASICGVCLRLDVRGSATCYPHNHGLTNDDVLGACSGAQPPPPAQADGGASSTDARICPPHPQHLPACMLDSRATTGAGAAIVTDDGGVRHLIYPDGGFSPPLPDSDGGYDDGDAFFDEKN